MAPCPSCKGEYVDLLDHIRKKHPQDSYTALQLQPAGLTPCPTCGTACKGDLGVRTHAAKIHGIPGSSRRKGKTPSPGNSPPRRRRRPIEDSPSPSPPPRRSESTLPPPTSPRGLGGVREPSRGPTTPSSTSGSLPSIGALLRPIVVPSEAPSTPRSPSEPPLHEDSSPSTTRDPPSPRESATLEEAHREALEPILQKASVQTLLAYSAVQIPEKRLHYRQATLFVEAAKRTAEAFIRNPREKTLLPLLLLPRVLGHALDQGQLAPTLRAYPSVIPDPPTPRETPPPRDSTPTERASRLLERGFIGRAARALTDPTPLAEETPQTLDLLRQKHPIGPRAPF
ncbi:hypothetical protein F5X68DRAFT_178868, partial [Plectosphaerella plurivora]